MIDSIRAKFSRRRSFVFSALALLALVIPNLGSAQMVVPLTIEQMAGVAEEVVHGTVVEEKTGLHNGKVYTLSTIQIHEAFKGSRHRGESVDVISLGGEIGPVSAMAPNNPKLKESEEVVVFLSNPAHRRRRSDAPQINPESPFAKNPQIVGGFQGKFDVVRDEVEHTLPGGRRVGQEIPRVVRVTPGQSFRKGDAPTLDQFATQLRETLNPTTRRRTMDNVATVGEVEVPEKKESATALRFFDPKVAQQNQPRQIKGAAIKQSSAAAFEKPESSSDEEDKEPQDQQNQDENR